MSRRSWPCAAVSGIVVASVWGLSGCGALPLFGGSADLPATLARVVEQGGSFGAAGEGDLEGVAGGTVIDDLEGLSGCWGFVATSSEVESPLALVVAYRFDRENHTFTRWSTMGLEEGGVPLGLALVTIESGQFEVRDESHIVLHVEQLDMDSNLPASWWEGASPENVTQNGEFVPYDRVALVTLSGDRMLLYIDAEEAPASADGSERPIFHAFDCPAER